MNTFIDLIKESVLTQFIITLLVLLVWGYLIISGHQVPETVEALLTLVVGFYFGSKLGIAQGKLAQSKEIKREDK